MNKIASITAALILALSSSPSSLAQSSEMLLPSSKNVVVEQGMRFHSETIGSCTIGYINDNLAYTAAHCFESYLGSDRPVYDVYSRYIGQAHFDPEWDKKEGIPRGHLDFAVIQLADSVTIGTNRYSGDEIYYNPQVGDEVCKYGSTTQEVQCGEITYIKEGEGTKYLRYNTPIKKGDSGGPLYSPTHGFIGLSNYGVGDDKGGEFSTAAGTGVATTGIITEIENKTVPGRFGGATDTFKHLTNDYNISMGSSESTAHGFTEFLAFLFSPILFIVDGILGIISSYITGAELENPQ